MYSKCGRCFAMKLLLVVSTLTLVSCRPQTIDDKSEALAVEIEKQNITLIEPSTTQKSQQASTNEILEKIAQVNKRQGLTTNGLKANADPTSSQSRSQGYQKGNLPEFTFPTNPFSNPIFDYLHKNSAGNAGKTEEETPHRQFIRRKVTHQVYIAPIAAPSQPNYYGQGFVGYPPMGNQWGADAHKSVERNSTNMGDLEKQTIDNIKNIVASSNEFPGVYQQSQQPFGYYYGADRTPYQPYIPPVYPQVYNPYVFGPGYPRPSRQELSWPWQQYFPIIIRDPLAQFLGAMTSMVEYGPEAQECSQGSKSNEQTRDGKSMKKLNYNIINANNKPEITIFGAENPNAPPEDATQKKDLLEIEDLKITEKNPVQFTLNFKTPAFEYVNKARGPKGVKEETKRITIIRPHAENPSPPIRDQDLQADELESETDEVVVDQTISKQDPIMHNNNKKTFSKDNTGSGIFIHKIKVKAGGVAIAGPGGIATAGSGGTAIVGPNGLAYTHPDSLAIAGSGSKVVSVDPDVDLEELANGGQNKTRRDGSVPRQGKVVAVGPVVYYNRG